MSAPDEIRTSRRSFKLLAWAVLPVMALAGFVQITGNAVDILLVAAAGVVLLGLERSVGDWLGEWFGPLAAAAIFVAAALALSWYFLSDSLGRSQTDRFFIEAERRGYRTAYYQTPRSAVNQGVASDSSAAATPVATGGEASRSGTPAAGHAPTETAAASQATEASDSEREDVVPPTPATAPGEQADAPARGSILSFFRRSDAARRLIATEIELSVSPSRVAPARRAVITATVRAGNSAVSGGTVDFTVNTLGAGRVQLNAQGVAATTFQTHIPGTYDVRARYSGSSEHASSRSPAVILTVTVR